ncbi:serine/threonine protein kinase, partial [Streptomyces populi]
PTSSGQDGADTENKATPAPVTPPPGSAQATPSAPSSPSASTDNLPSGYLIYCASEGFSIALPTGWQRLKTSKDGDNAYRATFGAADDPRTLAVTYTQGRVRSGPVAVWRDDVEPSLQQEEGYRRIGAIQATTYQGYRAADMEWAVVDDGTPLRTFGQGLLLGGGRSFSLRWTTPAADWDRKANRQALETFLRTFRPDPTG